MKLIANRKIWAQNCNELEKLHYSAFLVLVHVQRLAERISVKINLKYACTHTTVFLPI